MSIENVLYRAHAEATGGREGPRRGTGRRTGPEADEADRHGLAAQMLALVDEMVVEKGLML
jgi:hypothetical protein